MEESQKTSAELNSERDARCVPVAMALIRLFGEHKSHLLVEKDGTKLFDAYNPLAKEVLALLLSANLPVQDTSYVFQLFGFAREQLESIVFESLDRHMAEVQERTFGCRLNELPMADLHARLGGDTIAA